MPLRPLLPSKTEMRFASSGFAKLAFCFALIPIAGVPVCSVVAAESDAPQAKTPKPKNVLFLIADDLRPELGCYGNTIVQSPHIDYLAAQGLVFNRAYCQQAVCSPSRSSVMTGVRPDTNRVWNLTTHFRDAMPDVVTLPQLFKDQGYATMGLGKIYHGDLVDPPSWSIENKEQPKQKKQNASTEKPFNGVRLVSENMAAADDIPLTKTKRGPAFRMTDDKPNGGGEGKLADEAIAALHKLKDGGQAVLSRRWFSQAAPAIQCSQILLGSLRR